MITGAIFGRPVAEAVEPESFECLDDLRRIVDPERQSLKREQSHANECWGGSRVMFTMPLPEPFTSQDPAQP